MKEKAHGELNELALSDLRQMEVVDISEGRRLGFIGDIEFDDDLSHIENLIVPPQGSVFSLFKKKDEIKIRWDQIKVIGIDIILVDMSS